MAQEIKSLEIRFSPKKMLRPSGPKMVTLVFLAVSCCLESCTKDCPEDEYLDKTFHIMEESYSINTYQDNMKIVFRNEAGKETRYWASGFSWKNLPYYYDRPVGERCNQGKSSADLIAETQQMQGHLYFDGGVLEHSLTFYFRLGIEYQRSGNPYDTLLADVLTIASQPYGLAPPPVDVKPPSRIKIVASKRGKDLSFDELQENEYLGNVNFFGKDFAEVYVNDNGLLNIFYNTSQGIVAYEDTGGTLWVLDRFE